jgi:hypothetical protein
VDAVGVFDQQLAAVILIRLRQEERDGEVCADAVRRPRHLPDGVVNVIAERLPPLVSVEERGEDLRRQRRRHEERVAL